MYPEFYGIAKARGRPAFPTHEINGFAMAIHVGAAETAESFAERAGRSLEDSQLRRNVRHATGIIQAKRQAMTGELPDWQELRDAASAIKQHTVRYLDVYLEQFEANFTARGGQVHWARDADEANEIIAGIIQQHGGRDVIKVKAMTTNETRLNEHLEARGVTAHETDLADLIVQLGREDPSHIVVPALHVNRTQVREIFEKRMPLREMGIETLSDDPEQLAEAARLYLREKFLTVTIGISGANFAVAETGSLVVVESEGNGRMCLTLPQVLISLVGIEKLVPRFEDLEVMLQSLPRSATGERMNPYNSVWSGVTAGDGPRESHVVLLDNGRSQIAADTESRDTLNCIRCGACLNACPVYRQTGGHAYGSVYQGPIGAILTPQLLQLEHAQSLPYASSLCGACYEVCPVKIDIPEILIHLRGKIVRERQSTWSGRLDGENLAMQAMALVFSSAGLLSVAEALARLGQRVLTRDGTIAHLPGALEGWSRTRDLQEIPAQSFRQWWTRRAKQRG